MSLEAISGSDDVIKFNSGYFNYNANYKSTLSFIHCGIKQNEPNELCGPIARNMYLLHYVIDGKGTYYVNNTVYQLKKGDVFAIYPNDVVSYKSDKDEPWYFCWIGFVGTHAAEYYKQIGFEESYPVKHIGNSLFVKGVINCLDYINENKEENLSALRLNAFILEILASFETTTIKNSKNYIEKAILYIEINYNTKINLSEMASYLGLEYSYFFKIFKKALGISPSEYLINLRIEKAKILLNNKIAIKNIPTLVGISDVYYFTKLFKKYTGITPSAYIKSCQNNANI